MQSKSISGGNCKLLTNKLHMWCLDLLRKKVKMDTLRTPETPRAPRTSTARRNLFTDFENMDPPVCQTPEFPSPMSPEIDLSVYENDNDQRWRKFVTFWIIFIIGCVSAIAGFYSLWPSNLVIEFTREFQILIVIILTSVIFLSVLWKICCKRVANYEDQCSQK